MTGHSNAVAFQGDTCIASGELSSVALAVKKAATRQGHDTILVFNTATSEPIDLDLRGSHEDVLHRLPSPTAAAAPPRGPGRPKLGVVAREVTLLPRHWDWLASQSGGASVALRRLVEQAARSSVGKDRIRAAQNAAYRFMSAMAGDRAGFEDAARALFAGDGDTFGKLVAAWPVDIRSHITSLAADALQAKEPAA
jgi:hypothetical protein